LKVDSPVTSLTVDSLSVRAGASSITGKVRRHNEDSFLCVPGAYVVADGMGGHRAGDVASQLTIAAIAEWLAVGVPEISEMPAVVVRANDAVRDHAGGAGQHGMGSTMVGAFLARNADEDSIVVVNVGDSRCYALIDQSLEQLTSDHSFVQELVDAGEITPEAAAVHPDRNVVTRAIGIEAVVAADFFVVPPVRAVRLMLCSDGVSGELSIERIHHILSTTPDPSVAAEALTTAVLEGYARDNATAVVVDVVRTDVAPVRTEDVDITGPRVRPDVDSGVGVGADNQAELLIATVPMGNETAPSVPTFATDVIDEVPGG